MKTTELRDKYLEFFKSKEHAIIASASLIPENDPTVLFTTAGMHPLVPYLLGEKHPMGTRLTDVQKCVRTGDIDEVGDSSHCTFFEMLGNWSLGDYFKKESISWSYEFLTKVLEIPVEKLFVTVFEGDNDAPRDEESANIWQEAGIPKDHIFYLPKKDNWWGPAGVTGPCGPDTEIFYDTGKPKCSDHCDPSCSCGKYLEIWNNVFMEYFKHEDGSFTPLSQKNVDTGMGLDRTCAVLQGKESVFDTDAFTGILSCIASLCGKSYDTDEDTKRAFRIIADHMRASVFIIGDPKGVTPSNVDQGYILRRLLRRAIRYSKHLGIQDGSLHIVAEKVIDQYGDFYPELKTNHDKIIDEINKEEERFSKALTGGLKEFDKVISKLEGNTIDGKNAFRLYDTFGFPIEMTVELAGEKGIKVDVDGYKACFVEHQKKSGAGAVGKFKGGLADNTEATTRLHTATHLLLASLRKILGDTVFQRGSNITAERLRFDFSFERKLTKEELAQVEAMVNEVIEKDMTVSFEEMPIEKAREIGAMGIFDSKYGEMVKVYTVGDFSKEICGGPHVTHTGELGGFKIKKEESSSAGVRRIKAVLIDK